MNYRDILVYADADATTAATFDVAAALASAHDSHLAALHVSMPIYVAGDVVGPVPASVIEWQERHGEDRAAAARTAVDAVRIRSGRDIEWRRSRGDLIATAVLHARYADLAVVSQAGDEGPSVAGALPEALAMGSGRPVLVVPRYGRFPTLGERVLLAWRRTRESTRAVHDALPILARAKSVTVMEVNPESAEASHIAGADIARHLARHGVRAIVHATTADEIGVGDVILSRAADHGSDLIVMGAYGHSRLREFAFGGVTRHLLAHMTVPVLMSH